MVDGMGATAVLVKNKKKTDSCADGEDWLVCRMSGHTLVDVQKSDDGAYILTVASDAPEQLAEGLDNGTITMQVRSHFEAGLGVTPKRREVLFSFGIGS